MNDIDIHSPSHCHLNPEQISPFKGKTEPIHIENPLLEYALVGYPKKKELLEPHPLSRKRKTYSIEELIEKNYKRLGKIHEPRVPSLSSLEMKKVFKYSIYREASLRLITDVVRTATSDAASGHDLTVGLWGRSLKPDFGKKGKTILNFKTVTIIREFENKLNKFEDNLKKGFKENDLLQIDTIRNFAFEMRSTFPKSPSLLEKANGLLLAHYQNNLSAQMKKMERGANRDTIMELCRLRYIISRLENSKNIKQLEDESFKYAGEVISAGNKLAVILGVVPLE